MSELAGVYAIWLRELKRMIRDRGQLIGGISRPILWIVIMGIGLNPYFRGEVYGEVRFVVPFTYLQFLLPAVIVLNMLYTSVQSAVSLIWDREFGFLREVLVSPMSRSSIIIGKILGGATAALFHGFIVLILAEFVDMPLNARSVVQGLGFMFILAVGLTSLGIIIANRMRTFEGFGVFSNAVILPLYFTSSSVFPIDPALTRAQAQVVFPQWLVTVVHWNPLTYAVDTLRGVFIGFHQFEWTTNLIVVVGGSLLLLAIALWEFQRT